MIERMDGRKNGRAEGRIRTHIQLLYIDLGTHLKRAEERRTMPLPSPLYRSAPLASSADSMIYRYIKDISQNRPSRYSLSFP